MSFDTPSNRLGTHSVKVGHDGATYGVSAADGLAMWVADMEFRPPACVQDAVEKMAGSRRLRLFRRRQPYLDAIRWWMPPATAGRSIRARSLPRMVW
jgi:cysteine-S-conjugate beta-lyase